MTKDRHWVLSFVTSVILTNFQSCHAADPAPEGVKVYAMTFMDLDHSSHGYSSIITTSSGNAAFRLNISAANVNEYTLLRSANAFTSSYDSTGVQLYSRDNEGVVDRGILMVTEGSVSVVASRVTQATGDSYLALPLTVKATKFFIPSYPTMADGASFYGIAAASSSCLEVLRVKNGKFESQKRTLDIKKGQIFQDYGAANGDDFTGLYITSSAPVSVFSGHECAQVKEGIKFCDHLVEAIPAVEFWGSETVVPDIGGRASGAGYLLRILASQDTQINFPHNKDLILFSGTNGCACSGLLVSNCGDTCTIGMGEFVEVDVKDASSPVIVSCSKPCLVTQISKSYLTVPNETLDPDAMMSIITPTDHYVNVMTYKTPLNANDDDNGGFAHYVNYLSIIVSTTDRAGLRLDDAEVSDAGTAIGSYTVLTLQVKESFHKIHHIDPLKKVCAFAYGHSPQVVGGTTSSYGFPVAYDIDDVTIPGPWAAEIAPPSSVVDPDITTEPPRVCVRNAGTLLPVDVTVRGEDSGVGCLAAMTAVRLNTLRETINRNICDRVLCPTVPDNVYVTSLTAKNDSGGVHVIAILSANYDTAMSSIFECRLHLTEFLQSERAWKDVLSTADLAKCNSVVTTFRRISSEWACPSNI